MKKEKKKQPLWWEITSWVLTILAAVLLAVFINAYIYRTTNVNGKSMDHTLHNGQTLHISRLPYIFGDPEYNDIVVFDHEQEHRNFFVEMGESFKYNIISYKLGLVKDNEKEKYWIKRVIGLPGDTITFSENGVYRNGELLDEPYVNPDEIPNYSMWLNKSFTVGKDELFVMGDNRNHSSDSRYIGCIKQNSVLGKVI